MTYRVKSFVAESRMQAAKVYEQNRDAENTLNDAFILASKELRLKYPEHFEEMDRIKRERTSPPNFRIGEVPTIGECLRCGDPLTAKTVFCDDICREDHNLYLKRRKIKARKKRFEKECPYCKKTFQAYRTNQVYCCRYHRKLDKKHHDIEVDNATDL